MNLKMKLKPSLLGQYYEKQCDKYLVYRSIDSVQGKQLGWAEQKGFQTSAAALAGNDWERILLERLQADPSCKVICFNTDTKNEGLEKTIDVLKKAEPEGKTVYLYQPGISITTSFEEKYLSLANHNDAKAFFSRIMFPDFIKMEYHPSKGKFCLTVIDAKNASFLKVGAEIQIAVYVKILKEALKDMGVENCFMNEETGIVWNREKITDNCIANEFRIRDAEEAVEAFFSKKLVELCDVVNACENGTELQNKLDYRISQKCEYCENFEACKNHCAEKSSARMLPYITTAAQDRLQELMENGALEDDSIDAVSGMLIDSPELLTEDCSYWKNVRNNLSVYAKGIKSFYEGKKERFPKVGSSITFPIGQNFSLLLTAQQDVASGRVYAYAWLLRPGKNIDIWDQGVGKNQYVVLSDSKESSSGRGTYFDSVVATDNTVEEFDRIDRAFVESIYELLSRIDAYPNAKSRKLQCFVMDDYERDNIENALFHMLENLDSVENQGLLEKVMAILFWLQGERLVTDASLEPEDCVENPLTVLTTEISRLYVLSEGVSYSLKKTASIFSPTFNFDQDTSNYFGVLSNVVEGMSIIRAWEETDEEKKNQRLNSLGHHLRTRLFVENAIIGAIQRDNTEGKIHLSAWPTQYRLQKPKYPQYPEIARLDFENRYEELLKYHQIRSARINGIENAIDNGTILQLKYTGAGTAYEILNRENYVGREWFTAWLCEDTPENRLQIMLLRDTDYTSNPKTRFSHTYEVRDTNTVFYSTDFDMDYNFTDDGGFATVEFKPKKFCKFVPVEGKKYLFFEVYSDMNSAKTAAGIEKLVDRQELLSPKEMSKETGLCYTEEVGKVCENFWSPDGLEFSPSQKNAFIHLIEQRMSVLVGPPASGKTDFISRALITLANYYQVEKKQKLKIMVTAMSHSAIENVLLKLMSMLEKENPCGIQLCKAGRFDDAAAFQNSMVSVIGDGHVAAEMNKDEIQIIGMTSWSAYKEFHDARKGSMREFDVIVMDEASQVRAMDAFLNLECSNDNTRFLLVGDDDQLPPIIGGKYKEREGEKYIHGSIFRMVLTGLGAGHPDILQLHDNFRMNGILCKYSSLALYGPSYQAFNPKIRNQTIALMHKPKNELYASLLDPKYPLVFCELYGVSREQIDAEVMLVTELIHEVWEHQKNPETGNLAREDRNFWRNSSTADGELLNGACGIITPHHEHINRLKTSISNDLGLPREEIYIGTVDKLQGKERKTVIVSYGVAEESKIRNESEFIFSSNRLNVSLTRGKAKTIVFLSDAIAEPSLSTNIMTANNPALRKGIDFVHGFSAYMKTQREGEDLVTEEYPSVCGDVDLKVWKKRLAEE